MFRILVVEDDKELNRTVCTYLSQNGYEALACLSANEAYDVMYGGAVFDMIISDIMMPDIDGFEFAKTVRERNEEIPILFMTARDDFAAKQRGFRAGIDDYMVKPIDLGELLLRIGALLRRAKIAASKQLTVGELVLNAEEHSAYLGGKELSLTVREFNLLYKLLSYPTKLQVQKSLNQLYLQYILSLFINSWYTIDAGKTEVQENEFIASFKYKQITKRSFYDARPISGSSGCYLRFRFKMGAWCSDTGTKLDCRNGRFVRSLIGCSRGF